MSAYPTRKERNALTRELKDFAREQSPMFAEGIIHSAAVEQHYMFFDMTPEDIRMPGQLDRDETKLELGFFATRHLRDDHKKPYYSFDVWMTASRLLHPRQLDLSDDSWEMLRHKYLDEELSETLEEGDIVEGIEPLEDEQIRDEVIDEIIDEGDVCESYQNVSFSYSTAQPNIETSYERGTKVDGFALDVTSTHDTSDYDDDYEVAFPIGDNTLYIPPKLHEDELSIADEIVVRRDFLEIIRGLGLDKEANMNALLTHEDKLAQMMHLVECMRKRRIDVA